MWTYALAEADGTPFYVGITKDIEKRHKTHQVHTPLFRNPLGNRIRDMKTVGRRIVMIPLEKVEPFEARSAEVKWMTWLSACGHRLVNVQRAYKARSHL